MITPPKVDCSFGAPMGRKMWADKAPAAKSCHLTKVKMNGDYDAGGAYWGAGAPLYYFGDAKVAANGKLEIKDTDTICIYVRAWDRASALNELSKSRTVTAHIEASQIENYL